MLALLALPAVAAAGPQPIKKPDPPAKTTTPAKTKTTTPPASTNTNSSSSTNQTPIKKPDTGGTTGTGSTTGGTTAVTRTTTTHPKVVIVDVVGRDQRSAEITLPPLDTTPKIIVPDPTPLALVAVGDRVRSHSTPTPAWKLALLALLAAAEAFLVVRLVRHRPRGLSTAS